MPSNFSGRRVRVTGVSKCTVTSSPRRSATMPSRSDVRPSPMVAASSAAGGMVTLAVLTTVLSGEANATTAGASTAATVATGGGKVCSDGAALCGMTKPAARSSLSSRPAAPAAPIVATPSAIAAVAKSARRRRSRVATRFSLRQRKQTGIPGPTSWGQGGAARSSDMAGSRGGGNIEGTRGPIG